MVLWRRFGSRAASNQSRGRSEKELRPSNRRGLGGFVTQAVGPGIHVEQSFQAAKYDGLKRDSLPSIVIPRISRVWGIAGKIRRPELKPSRGRYGQEYRVRACGGGGLQLDTDVPECFLLISSGHRTGWCAHKVRELDRDPS